MRRTRLTDRVLTNTCQPQGASPGSNICQPQGASPGSNICQPQGASPGSKTNGALARRTLLTMTLWGTSALLPALTCSHSHAQEPHAPVANAIGRFFGFGYSAGYHAVSPSQLGFHHYSPTHNVVPQPPRGMYAMGPNLGYGQPIPGTVHSHAQPMMGYPSPAPQLPISNQDLVPAPPGQPSPSQSILPAKPEPPPPSWLKQFLKDQAPAGGDDDSLLNEESPSDRRGVYLQLEPQQSTASLMISPADGSESVVDTISPASPMSRQTVQYPSLQYPVPQYPVPQYPVPQYPVPQYSVPQYSVPQYTAPPSPGPQFVRQQYVGPQYRPAPSASPQPPVNQRPTQIGGRPVVSILQQ